MINFPVNRVNIPVYLLILSCNITTKGQSCDSLEISESDKHRSSVRYTQEEIQDWRLHVVMVKLISYIVIESLCKWWNTILTMF